jgi:tetratricopeptide (TPR) repeat protein
MEWLMKVLRGLLLLNVLGFFAYAPPALAAQPSKKDIADCASMDEQTAIKGCTALIKKSPKNPRAQMAGYMNRGLAYQRLRENDKAMADFDAGIKLIPEKTMGDDVAYNLYLNRGRLKYELKDYRGSATDSEAATKIDGTKPDAFTNWAYALLELDEFELAAKQVWWANAVRPDHPPTLALSGILSFYLGKYDDAVEHTNRAIELQPGLTWALANRAVIRWWQNDLAGAMTDLDGVIAAWPNYAWAHALRARIHVMRNELAEARRESDAALAADPNLARALFTKGLVDMAEGKADDARAAFVKAYELDATLTEALSMLGDVERAQGNLPNAIEWYDRMIAAPVKADQDKVRREAAIAARAAVQDEIDRPAKLATACVGGPAEGVVAACKEALELTTEPARRLPLLIAKLKAEPTLFDANEILIIEPRNFAARMARGDLRLRGFVADAGGALADFTAAHEIEPENPAPLTKRAEAHMSRSDQVKALADVEAALARAPEHREALVLKFMLHDDRKELKDAAAAAERLTARDPSDVFAWGAAARTFEALGDDARAESAATRAIELDPQFGTPKRVRGAALFRKGDMAAAAAELSRALAVSLSPDETAAALRMRAQAFLALGNAAAAIEDAERLIFGDPKDIGARALRASANFMRCDAALALADSAEVLNADPKNADMYLLRIAAHLDAWNAAQAVKDAEAAMAALPDDARFVIRRGEALLALGKAAEALADFDKAQKLAPGDVTLVLLRARASMDAGNADAALEAAGMYLDKQPESTAALTIKGEALLAKRDLAPALEALEAALKLDGGNIRALKLSGDLYAALGTNDLALQHYAKAIARKPKSETDAAFVEAARTARARLIEELAGKSAQ